MRRLLLLIGLSEMLFMGACSDGSDGSDGSHAVNAVDTARADSDHQIAEFSLKRIKLDSFATKQQFEVKEFDANKLSGILMKKLPKVMIDQAPHWVVESDQLMDKDDLYLYCQRKLTLVDTQQRKQPATAYLTVATRGITAGINGENILKWPDGQDITYSVLKKSFSDTKNYYKVVRRINRAAAEWMSFCNVKFVYKPENDNMDPAADMPDDLTFIVREQPIAPALATAFYPFDPPYKRRLYIDPILYYKGPYDSIGTFRHELGHILGFRHEKIWSRETECMGESLIVDYLGAQLGGMLINDKYDSMSVMHYKCGNSGSYALDFTPTDKISAASLYGSPVH